ncbi:serine/arginine repetitive matrix protein 1-like [Triticum dicoccoides]|uniref:serine/arginine repetitive matrix protein 1-like n=1 Tax=Triticum dicoccoides TaxID=85692 RepID=UPI0018919B55|nr:serine/arginine repetitive matrix protein 1-like [Triticum dicoccoides]
MRPPPLAHGQIRQCPAAGDQNQQDRRVHLLFFLPILLLSSVFLTLTHLLSLFRSSPCRLELKPPAVQGLPRNGYATTCLILAHARPRHRSPARRGSAPPPAAVLRVAPRSRRCEPAPRRKSSASPSRAACSRAKPDSQPWSPSSSSASNPPPPHLLQALEHEHELASAPPLSSAPSAARGAGTHRCRAASVDAVNGPMPLTPARGRLFPTMRARPCSSPPLPIVSGLCLDNGNPRCPCAPASSPSRPRPPRVFLSRPSLRPAFHMGLLPALARTPAATPAASGGACPAVENGRISGETRGAEPVNKE